MASGSRLQFTLFTLFTSSPPQEAGLRLLCASAPGEPPSPAPKRKHAHIECTGREYLVPRGSSVRRSRDARPPPESRRGRTWPRKTRNGKAASSRGRRDENLGRPQTMPLLAV